MDEKLFLENFSYLIEKINEDLNFQAERIELLSKEVEKLEEIVNLKNIKANLGVFLKFLENLEGLSEFLGKEKVYLEDLENLFERLKKENPLFFEEFNCYFYLRKNFLFFKKEEKSIIKLNEEYINFIEKLKQKLNVNINIMMEILSEIEEGKSERKEELKKELKLLSKLLNKAKQVIKDEIDHIVTIKNNINRVKRNLEFLKVDEIIFSKESLKSLKELFKKSINGVKNLVSKLENLALEGVDSNQIEVFREESGISLAKYPRGHGNLRVILNYNLFEKGKLFIMDVVKHDKKYENWHKEEIPQNSTIEALKLSKFVLTMLLDSDECKKQLAKIILDKS